MMKFSLRSTLSLAALLALSACGKGGGQISGMWDGAAGIGETSTTVPSESTVGQSTVTTPAQTAEQFESIQRQIDIKPIVTEPPIVITEKPVSPDEPAEKPSEQKIEKGISAPKSCLQYLPESDAVAVFNPSDFDQSILKTKLEEADAGSMMKLLEGVKEICFAIKYSNSLASGQSVVSEANQAPQQMLSLNGDYAAGYVPPAYESPGRMSLQSNAGRLSAQNSLQQAEPAVEPTMTEQVQSGIESFVAVAICDDVTCVQRLADACREKAKTDAEAGKASMACTGDKNIFVTGTEAWANTLVKNGVIVAGEENRFEAVLATTRAATLKLAGAAPEWVKNLLREKFTTISFAVEEKTDSFFVAALTAGKKLYLHLKIHADLKEAEPLAEALVFLKLPENVSFDQMLNAASAPEEPLPEPAQ